MNPPAPEDSPVPITEEETRLLEQLRANPEVAEQFRAIMDRFDREVADGMDAHQAEMMVIQELQELGRSLLSQWAGRTQQEVLETTCQDDPSLIGNGKKNSSGIRPSEPLP